MKRTRKPISALPKASSSLVCVALAVSVIDGMPKGKAQTALPLPSATTNAAQDLSTDKSTVTITSPRAQGALQFEGFANTPIRQTPASIAVYDALRLQDAGVQRLADMTKLDAAVSDSYNAIGYWDFLTLRGFTLNPRSNYRREGLPISAETSIALDNKERIEILKGTSGMQAGISAPGGLVNYVVKRPSRNDLRLATLEVSPRGGWLTGLDSGGHWGADKSTGYRFNATYETLRPSLQSANGSRHLMSLALDQRLGGDSLLEGEIEYAKRTQPSQAAFSLQGGSVPAPVDPNINLNNQPWTLPVVVQGTTATIRFTQAISTDWRWIGQLGTQRLKTDDRMAFPWGYDCANPQGCANYFSANGLFDLYDYRSEGERRQSDALRWQLDGSVAQGEAVHHLSFALLAHHQKDRLPMQAYNLLSGYGSVTGDAVLSPNATLNTPGVQRDDRTLEGAVSDRLTFDHWQLLGGLRGSGIRRASVKTDGTEPVAYAQKVTTPFASVGYQMPTSFVYLSAGQGAESFVTPNNALYSSAGAVLPVQKSRQLEWGIRSHRREDAPPSEGPVVPEWSIALFRIWQPRLRDAAPDYLIDGRNLHKGIEAQWRNHIGVFRVGLSAMLLKARVQDALIDTAYNGNKPINVPANTAKVQLSYRAQSIAGLESTLYLVREGPRAIDALNTLMLPGWTRYDAAFTYRLAHARGKTMHVRLGIDNLTDKRYWRESPFMFSHYYLYPGSPRTARLSVSLSF